MTTSPAESIAFTCAACGFHARLAPHYHGKAIKCPGCEAPQLVGIAAAGAPKRASAPGKVAFDCVACNHHADISSDYAGKVVWCPGCNAVQIVPRPEAAEPAPAIAETLASGETAAFSCQACGFQSRVVPSGVNGVVYCLACRAPQKMVASLDDDLVDLSSLQPTIVKPDKREVPTERIEAKPSAGEAETNRIENPAAKSALRDLDDEILTELAIGSDVVPAAAPATTTTTTTTTTTGSLDDALPTFIDDEPAAIADAAPAAAKAETTPAAPATTPPARSTIASDAVTPPSLPSAKTPAPGKAAVRPGRPGRPGAKEPGNSRTTSVQVSQRGARKVYKAVDPNAATKDERETTDDGESAPAAAASGDAKKGLLGRLSSKFFRRGG